MPPEDLRRHLTRLLDQVIHLHKAPIPAAEEQVAPARRTQARRHCVWRGLGCTRKGRRHEMNTTGRDRARRGMQWIYLPGEAVRRLPMVKAMAATTAIAIKSGSSKPISPEPEVPLIWART